MRYSHEDDYDDEEINKNFFDKDDEDDEDEFEKFLEDGMDEKFYYENQKFKILEIAVKQQYLKRKLLIDSIKTLQKSFWWNFCSWETRLSWISRTYETFSNLVFGSQEKEEDEDAII